MSEEGKFYWLKLQGTRHPALYIGETQASRMKFYVHVQKPSCCIVHKGGPKLDKWIEEKNAKNAAEFAVEQAAFDAKYPPGTPPGDFSPTLVQYEAVEVVAYTQKGKQAWKVKK